MKFLNYSDRVLIYLTRRYEKDHFNPVLNRIISVYTDETFISLINKELMLIDIEKEPKKANKLVSFLELSTAIKKIPIDTRPTTKKKVRKKRKTAKKNKVLSIEELEERQRKLNKELEQILSLSNHELLEDINLKDV